MFGRPLFLVLFDYWGSRGGSHYTLVAAGGGAALGAGLLPPAVGRDEGGTVEVSSDGERMWWEMEGR